MKILMYYSDWTANADRQAQDTYGGVGYYRIKKVSEQIKDHQVDLVGAKLTRKGESATDRWERIFKEYDVFWSCYTSHAEDAAALFYWRDKLGKKVIMDLDDNFWDVPESHALHDKLQKTKKDRAFISTILSFADIITVSTEPLKQKVEEHMKNVFGLDKKVVVIPNFNDVNDWKYRVKKNDPKKVVIGYAGSNSHHDDLEMVLPVINKLMDKYENLHFQCVGAVDKKALDLFYKYFSKENMYRCDLVNPSSTFLGYPKRMAQVRWDICIAPLVDTAFTRCKSHIKWMEYAMYKRPTIASRVYPYFMELQGRETIKDGETGILVRPKDWESALEELIVSPEKRNELGESAYNQVMKDWQYSNSGINEIVSAMLVSPEGQK
jgi:glycosyltransferase involved in cell wall biosynthesis